MKKGIYYLKRKNFKKVGLADFFKEVDPEKKLQQVPFLLSEKKKLKQKDGTVEYQYEWKKVSILPSTYEPFTIQTIDENMMEVYEALWEKAVRYNTEQEDLDKKMLEAYEYMACDVFSQGALMDFLQKLRD